MSQSAQHSLAMGARKTQPVTTLFQTTTDYFALLLAPTPTIVIRRQQSRGALTSSRGFFRGRESFSFCTRLCTDRFSVLRRSSSFCSSSLSSANGTRRDPPGAVSAGKSAGSGSVSASRPARLRRRDAAASKTFCQSVSVCSQGGTNAQADAGTENFRAMKVLSLKI